MAEIPVRTCRDCGATYPLDATHWYRDRQRFRPICKQCTRTQLAALKAAAKQRRAAARAVAKPTKPPKQTWMNRNPTGKGYVPGNIGGYQPKKPPRDASADFDTALLKAARPMFDEIAAKIVKKALKGEGDLASLKFVADRIAGMGNADETPLARSLRVLAAERADGLRGDPAAAGERPASGDADLPPLIAPRNGRADEATARGHGGTDSSPPTPPP